MTDEPAEDGGDADEEERGIFAPVVGRNGAKAVCRKAVRDGTVHVNLQGPPASGKSTMLMAIRENVPGAVYRDGERFTPTRVQSTLQDDPPILLIDEFDALDSKAYEVLSTPLEKGEVIEDTHDETSVTEIDTQVIVACNSTHRIPDHIMTRFKTVPFQGYAGEEIDEVVARMLPEDDDAGWVEDSQTAREVSQIVREKTEETTIRDVRWIARMSESIEGVEVMTAAVNDADADVESEPLLAEEIPAARKQVGREKVAEKAMEEAGLRGQKEQIDAEIEAAVEEAVEEHGE